MFLCMRRRRRTSMTTLRVAAMSMQSAAAAASQCCRRRLSTSTAVCVGGTKSRVPFVVAQPDGLYGSLFRSQPCPPAPPSPLALGQHCCSSRSSSLHTTRLLNMPLDEFRDVASRQDRATQTVGRAWSVTELRRKSFDDLHKLWFILYKERNMLLTEQQLSRQRSSQGGSGSGLIFLQPERFKKVQQSMAAIRHVLGERKRLKIETHHLQQKQKQNQQQDNEKQQQEPQQQQESQQKQE